MGCEVSYDIDTISTADVIYVLRMQKERMLEGANYVPSLREYSAEWGVTSARVRPGQKVMHPGPMNRGVEIDGDVADAANALIEAQVKKRPRGADGGALRPAHARPGRGQGRRDPGGGLMLVQPNRPKEDIVVRGARVVDPTQRLDEVLDVRIDGGTIAEVGSGLDANGHRVIEGEGLRARAGVRRPARPSAHARPRGRGGSRLRARGQRRRAATAPSSPCRTPIRSSTRPRCSARSSSRRGARPRFRSGSSPRSRRARPGPS